MPSRLIPDRAASTHVSLGPWRAVGKLIAPHRRKSVNETPFPLGVPEESVLLARQLEETGAWQFRALTSFEFGRAFDVIIPESSVDFIRTVESIVRPARSLLADDGGSSHLRIPADGAIQLQRVGWTLKLEKGRSGEDDSLDGIPEHFSGSFSIKRGNFSHAQLGKHVLFNAIEPASDLTLQPDLIIRFSHAELGNLEAVVYKTAGSRIFNEFKGLLTVGQQSQDGTGGSAVSFDLDNYVRDHVIFKGHSPRGRMTVDYMSHMAMHVEGPAKVKRLLGGETEVLAKVSFDLSEAYPIFVDPLEADA